MSIVFSSDALEVHHSEGASDYLLITFNNFADLANGKTFWGQKFIQAADIACLSFMAKERSWFPEESMVEAMVAVAEILANYSTIIAYGNSMGAYAVLKYSARLGVTHALAFNPQFSIKPGVVKSDQRFISYYQPSIHGDMEIDAGDLVPLSYVIYDPRREDDNEHAELIAQHAGVSLVPVRFSDHVSVWVIGGTERAASLINWIATTDADVSFELYKKLNVWKKDLPHYRLYLALALFKCHRRWSLAILESIMTLPTLNAALGLNICRLLTRNGYSDVADGLALKMMEKFPHAEGFMV